MPYALRPGAAHVWVRCAGHVYLAVPEPDGEDDDTNEVREDGTACHWAAHLVATGQDVQEGAISPNRREIDSGMLDAAHLWRDVTQSWGAPVRYEQPVHCAGIHEQCGGTPDAYSYDAATRTLRVADLKYGFRIVLAEENWQLLCYVDGAARALGLNPLELEWVELVIVQPRAFHPLGVVRTWRIRGAELLPYFERLATAAHAALQPGGPCVLNPGCFNASCRTRCPTFLHASHELMHASYAAIPHDMSFEDADATLHYLRHACEMLDAYRTGLEEQVKHGITKQGKRALYSRMEGGVTPLQWKSPEAQERARAWAKLTGVSITKPDKLITPTQALKLLPAEVIDLYAERRAKTPTLKPVDATKIIKLFDKRS